MKKIITIDLCGVKNENDIIYRFRKALNLFHLVSEEEYKRRIKTNSKSPSWSALDDDMAALHFVELESVDNPQIYLIIKGGADVVSHVSSKAFDHMKNILELNSDLKQRIDKYNFSFELA